MERRTLLTGIAAVGAVTLLGCSSDKDAPKPPVKSSVTPADPTTSSPGRPTLDGFVTSGIAVPWGIAFLDDGGALVSLRDEGRIVRVSADGETADVGEIAGVIGGGEGGLLGIAIPPDDDKTLFAYVTTNTDDRIVRMEFTGDGLGPPREILTGIPIGSRHHGGRLLFDDDGALFVSTGDSGNGALAQDRDSLAGKVLRIDHDGKAFAGNPFDNRTWSFGHRNIEALAFDADGRLWAAEFGEKKADELNLIERGGNFGWPEVEGVADNGDFINPKVTWGTDECSPAGLAITQSTAYVGALQGECLFAVPLDGTAAGEPVRYSLGEHGRIRTVALAPDDTLWVTTSNRDGRGDARSADDKILRVRL